MESFDERFAKPILYKLHSLEDKVSSINKKNAFNCKSLVEKVNAVFDLQYQTDKVREKKTELLFRVNQLLVSESLTKSERPLGHLKFRTSEAYELKRLDRFSKFTSLFYANEFKLKKKIL